jgi:transglutaminase-like putative cysteine protease
MNGPQITVLDQRAMGWLLIGMGLTILPHLLHLPLWAGLLTLAVGMWRWLAARRNWPLPDNKLKLILTLGLVVAIFANYGNLVGRESGTALLVIMMGLKLMELRQRRDVLVLMFLAYFILVTHFLYSQSIPLAIYIFTVAWLLLSLHIYLNGRELRPMRQSLRSAGGMMLLGLPLMLALFVLFPRIEGPIWGLPKDAYSGLTGLGDTMTPGAISNLSQSDAVAFRVKFDGEAPPPDKRYWRGPVMWTSDGRTWTPGPLLSRPGWQVPPLAAHGDPVGYTVTLEPHNRRWLYALDLPASTSEYGRINREYQLVANQKVHKRLKYHMLSYTDYNTGTLPEIERRLALLIPRDHNPRTLALGRELRRMSRSGQEVVARTLAMFRQQPFVYSLTPPRLTSNDPSDEFLFQTRTGFCEHFASSFTLLMRAAGIPARVVTGYQGGELNPVDGYYVVRQRDAHAWSEVWLPGRGWVRVDPTAAVAPERIERSIDTSTIGAGAVRFNVPQSELLARAWRQLQLNLDAINNRWNQWVLSYGPQRQAEFLNNLGLDIKNWRQLAWVFALVIGGLLVCIAIWLLRPQRLQADPVLKIYRTFCRKLARRGLVRRENETAGDFARRIKQQRPELARQVDRITALYAHLRYAGNGSDKQLLQFKQNVVQFKP